MIRAFENEKRVATAVILKDGSILQVYPHKRKYEDEEAWKSNWVRFGSDSGQMTFQKEEKNTPRNPETENLSRAQKEARQNVLTFLSLGNPADTPMQALVRKLYNQEGIRDSIRSTATDARNVHYGMRIDPGLYVMLPENGSIVPVYFNRKSGMVFFGCKDETNEATDGLKFYRKYGCQLNPITVAAEAQRPDQKAIVTCGLRFTYSYNALSALKQLKDAGFHVHTYHYKYRPTPEAIKEIFRVVPNCQAIIWQANGSLIYYWDLSTTDMWNCKNTNLNKWIEEHK
jgi:hypothetical protein